MSPIFRNRSCALVWIAFLVLFSAGCNKLKARDNLNKGVSAYKAGQYDSAIESFKKAKELGVTLD